MPQTSTADVGGLRPEAIGAHGDASGVMARFRSMPRPVADLLLFAAVGLAYSAGSLVAYSWFGALVSPTFFASAGVTVGALVLVGSWRRRAVVLAAAATAEICVNVFHGGMDVAPAAGYALANVSEASLAAFLIIAIARGAPLAERRGLAGLLVGMLVAPWLGGSIAVGVIALDGGDVDATSYIGHWWIGDALGILLVGGALIAAATEERRDGRFYGELGAFAFASAVAAGAALWSDVWPAGYVPLVLTLVAAWRVGALGVLVTAGVAAAVVAEAAASGESLFDTTGVGPGAAIVYAQTTIGVVVVTALVFVVLLHENAESRAELAASEARARELANEQAALRRVATLAARGASPEELFSAVADEIAGVIDIPVVGVNRYEADGAFTSLGIAGETHFTVGSRWPVEEEGIAGMILATGRPAHRDDYSEMPGQLGEAVRKDRMESTVGVPIVVDGSIWGFMVAAATPGRPIPSDIEKRLVRFTELVGTAISNAESRESLMRLADEQAALRRVATLVAAGIEPEESFAAVCKEIARLFTADWAAVGRYEPDGSGAVLVGASQALPGIPIGSRAGLDKGIIAGEIYRTGRPARDEDAVTVRAVNDNAARFHALGFVSTVGAPIVVKGELWGYLAASSAHASLPSDTEERIQSFGELVATAIANTESRVELAASEARARDLADEQAALRRVATLVAGGASPDELFSAVAAEVADLIDIPVAGINRYEADGTFTMVGVAGETRFTVGSRWPVEDEGIAGKIRATGRPARSDDHSALPGRLGEAIREDLMTSTIGVPIVVDGSIWGFLGAAARPGKPIPDDIEQRLVRFTELVATAVSNTTTRTELISSRARVVSAADETRRRLERDLHDGIQQWLVGLALRARKAASLTAGKDSIRQEVSSLADDLVAVTEELREISRGIHPAILTDAGLDDALKALARRSPVPVDLNVEFEGRFDPTLEATVYYVMAESITNAAKHARASRVSVRGGRRDGTIELEIRDDGVGGADPRGGSGLIGLRDRVDTLGGTISFASPAGAGTTISMQLPTTLRAVAETSA